MEHFKYKSTLESIDTISYSKLQDLCNSKFAADVEYTYSRDKLTKISLIIDDDVKVDIELLISNVIITSRLKDITIWSTVTSVVEQEILRGICMAKSIGLDSERNALLC